MDQLQLIAKAGQLAAKIQEIQQFPHDNADFAALTFKTDERSLGIAFTGKSLDDFSAETWQVFYPYLRQALDEYVNALGAELDRVMGDILGEPTAEDAA